MSISNRMKVLVASHNPAKIKDYSEILTEQGMEVVNLSDLQITDQAPEDQLTYRENALAKALFYYRRTGLPTIADDGGFEIDYLDGQPGVKSRRWLGYETTDQEIVEHLLEVLKDIPDNQRTGRFINTLCLVKSEKEYYCAEDSIEGFLTEKYRPDFPPGFPFRGFFIDHHFNKFLMDLTSDEYKQINHRRKSVMKISQYLK